jgi:Ala-tRNA(Pro) deacylase
MNPPESRSATARPSVVLPTPTGPLRKIACCAILGKLADVGEWPRVRSSGAQFKLTHYHAAPSVAADARSGYQLANPPSFAFLMPASPDDLLAYLKDLGVETETVEHPPLFTVEDSRTLRGEIPGGHTKNLFVKDKKGRLFLLVLGEETLVDLKKVHETIGAQGRVSFGSAELLEEVWGVRPGAVTPFGAINDKAASVSVVLDEAMMRHERLNFHPLVNTRTTGLKSADLIKFLRATGHEPLVAALGQDQAGG